MSASPTILSTSVSASSAPVPDPQVFKAIEQWYGQASSLFHSWRPGSGQRGGISARLTDAHVQQQQKA